MDLPEIYFATHNLHKIEEVANILTGLYEVKGLYDLNLKKEIPETGATLEENSSIKARYLFENFQINCFADDTGLEVESLNGAPGVLSARYAGEPKDNNNNMDLLLSNLEGAANRNARFRTVITLIKDGREVQFEGIVEGKIIEARKGSGGFGYDPIFMPHNFKYTFAQMSSEEKNSISHRGQAIDKLVKYLSLRSS